MTGITIEDIPITESTDPSVLNRRLPVGTTDIKTVFYYTPSTKGVISKLSEDKHYPTCNVDLSTDPFFDSERIVLDIRGNNETQGLILENSPDYLDRVIITGCQLSTSACRIKQWTKRLKNAILLSIDNTSITSRKQAIQIITQAIKK